MGVNDREQSYAARGIHTISVRFDRFSSRYQDRLECFGIHGCHTRQWYYLDLLLHHLHSLHRYLLARLSQTDYSTSMNAQQYKDIHTIRATILKLASLQCQMEFTVSTDSLTGEAN